ncbi:peptidase family M1-domain-containing protein [Lentinula edodes]|uniref:peptidase family M1-domain-containing protein n=1 Tax=Lentinula edodes TaxID=5353 RepID=UPI001E8D320C|nr:peptidase family M1-domain-containing protein [Lentinula edodes]KAH7881499.1 peptidase family M1-domain-containing protein [Lentinula edodes]
MADDPTSQANYTEIATEHVSFKWTIDFANQKIAGSATHDLRVLKDDIGEVIFDTADLVLESVEVEGKSASYEVKPKHPIMGSALHIPLPSGLKSGSLIKATIKYETTKECTALQWLAKEQTQGKSFPYLFSQCQPIYARAMAPVQDSPSVKIKYSAEVTSILPALMSAIRQSPPSDGPAHDGKVIGKDAVTYVYHQPIPIPSYLIAIAAGNVVYRPFPRLPGKEWTCGIWSEPELIEAAYWEFSEDTARFLASAEDIVVPYRFGVYDLLVLPPSFPYGGMENACLTFLTPTLLAGDRTLVDVIAHELTHSWFGNGVTHAHASHFWLNEGWTTYIERLLLQVIHSPAERGFSFIIGNKALKDDLEMYVDRPKYQRLVIEFEKGEDPDDAYSGIPYDKGANLILHLERTLGGLDVFLPYVRDYVSTFMGKSITTQQWKSHLYGYYERNGGAEKIKALDSIDWEAWFYGEGLELPVKMEYDSSLAESAYKLAERWDSSRSVEISKLAFQANDLDAFSSTQKVVFLERLQSYKPLPSSHIEHLASLYKVSSTHNAEIRLRFYQFSLVDPSSPAAQKYAAEAADWVIGGGSGMVVGRMKFCRDVFRAVFKVNKDLAVNAFQKEKNSFHPIARKLIEKESMRLRML